MESIDCIKPRVDLAYYLDCPIEVRKERYLLSHSTDPRDQERFTLHYTETLKLDLTLKRKAIADGYQNIPTNKCSLEEAAHLISCSVLAYLEKVDGK